MRKLAVVMLFTVLLTGCSLENRPIEQAMELRTKLLAADCFFDARITADYGDQIYSFSMGCEGKSDGTLTFTVAEPETLAGISGQIGKDSGKLTFGDVALEFPLMADGQVSPVSAPWLLLKTLQGGYLAAAGMEADQVRLTVHDSYEEDALQLDIWLGAESLPVRAEILYAGRRILTLEISDFRIL